MLRARRIRPCFTQLEQRLAPAAFRVNSFGDTGAGAGLVGDLRFCIDAANTNGQDDTIDFDPIVFANPQTIILNSPLPTISGNVTIRAAAPKTAIISGQNMFRIFNIDGGAAPPLRVTLERLTLSNGQASSGNGGAILIAAETVTLNTVNVTLSTAPSGNGGGIAAVGSNLIVNTSTFASNTSKQKGGGIYLDAAVLSMNGSTMTSNKTTVAPDMLDGGGAIYFFTGGASTISNSTLENNQSAGRGGAFKMKDSGTVKITNSTVKGNTAITGGKAIDIDPATLNMISTIVFGDKTLTPDVFIDAGSTLNYQFSDIGSIQNNGTLNDQGNNLPIGTDPLFDPAGLQDNGGLTQTIALLPGSPVIDAGANPDGLATDQRGPGFSRSIGVATDMGSFETVPAGSITGQVYENRNDTGAVVPRDLGETPLADRFVYLDVNNDLNYDAGTLPPVNSGFGSTGIVPDNVPAGIDFFLFVSGYSGAVADINVNLDITMTWDSDLIVRLIAPNGLAIILFSRVGGSGDDFQNTILDDQATTPIASGTAPFNGSYRPAQPLATFNQLDGANLNGQWRLHIADVAGGDTATLNNWSLDIKSGAEPSTMTDANGNYAFLKQNPGSFNIRELTPTGWNLLSPLGGTNSGFLASSSSTVSGLNFGEGRQDAIYGTTYVDNNADVMFDKLDATLADVLVYDDSNFNGTYDVNPAKNSGPGGGGVVPDNNPAGLSLPLAVSGFIGNVVDINVNFDATMTWDGDIRATLIAPNGTTIKLFSNVGGDGDNFTNTVFDDQAAISIAEGTAPFTGSFRPEQPLSTFNGLSAAILNGIWTLKLVDTAGADTMTVNSWSLDITTGEQSAVSDEFGNYVLANLPPGVHNIRRLTPTGLINLEPLSGVHNINLPSGATVQNKNFGHIAATPAKVAAIVVNKGASQRSMVTSVAVTFDSKVSFVGSPASAFAMQNQKTSNFATLAAGVDGTGTVVTLTFTGGSVDLAGSLSDGRYTFTIIASQFAGNGFDGDGNGVGGDNFVEVGSPTSPRRLFRLFGDANGDGTVSSADFSAFRGAFGGSSPTFDFEGNGSVGIADFGQFRIRFGASI